MPPDTPRGALRPVELATAAVMGSLTTVLAVVGWLLPHASVLQSLGAVPMGVVAHRHRPRAVVAAAVAASVVSFLCAGTGPVFSVFTAAVVGGLVGDVKRRGRGVGSLLLGAMVAAPVLAGLTDLLLVVFSSSRELTLRQLRDLARGATGVIARVPGFGGSSSTVDRFVNAALRDWWLTVGAVVVLSFAIGLAAAWVVLGGVLERMDWMHGDDLLDPGAAAGGAPGPLPVHLDCVSVRYPGMTADALHCVDLGIDGPGLTALVGTNGSGKSTLSRVLAGRVPTSGRVERPGSPGLGAEGGTALVAQRPESQVLGVRVGDDVVWGLPAAAAVDVEGLLVAVGMAGMAGRETSTLSGGELQRVAIAAALARRPALLVSDESTAMIDGEGRRDLMALLCRLPDQGTAVVHVTHRAEEAALADRVVQLAEGRVVHGDLGRLLGPPTATALPPRPLRSGPHALALLEVRGVSHTYGEGTPWAQPALRDVELSIDEGDGILVVGGNGSGKSTLAWVLAGLVRPQHGTCLLDGAHVSTQVGAVGLAFQHARLQLQRPTVGADVRAASGIDADAVTGALGAVGLDGDMADRRLDQLSGGQQRRVAIAGLLARRPRVLVLDEPLAGLDPPGRRSLLGVLAGLRDGGMTLVVISHDLEGMEAVCDRTVRLAGGCIVDSTGAPAAAGSGADTGGSGGPRAVAR